MTSQDERIRALEARLQHLEDINAINQLLSSYGPVVDRGDAEATAGLWVEGGLYDWGGGRVAGRAALRALVQGEPHQAILAGGGAHVLSMPQITVTGDRATAICYSRLYRREREAFVLFRLSSNCFELVRTKEGWRIKSRITRLLDGSAEARTLLAPGTP